MWRYSAMTSALGTAFRIKMNGLGSSRPRRGLWRRQSVRRKSCARFLRVYNILRAYYTRFLYIYSTLVYIYHNVMYTIYKYTKPYDTYIISVHIGWRVKRNIIYILYLCVSVHVWSYTHSIGRAVHALWPSTGARDRINKLHARSCRTSLAALSALVSSSSPAAHCRPPSSTTLYVYKYMHTRSACVCERKRQNGKYYIKLTRSVIVGRGGAGLRCKEKRNTVQLLLNALKKRSL